VPSDYVDSRSNAQEGPRGERYGKRKVHNTWQYVANILSKLDFWPSKAQEDQLEELTALFHASGWISDLRE